MFSLIISYGKGVCLGSTLCMLGYVLDYTVSITSQTRIIKEKGDIFVKAHQHIIENLMIISPFVYALIDQTLLKHAYHFSWVTYSSLIVTHNLGYFFVHREMHRNRELYQYHKFHHCFDKIVTPSIGNAVSREEFCMAYMSPFILGAIIFQPTELTFVSSIGTIGLFNLLIHMYELKDISWFSGMVSPPKHITYHDIKNQNYSATVKDLDAISDYGFVDP